MIIYFEMSSASRSIRGRRLPPLPGGSTLKQPMSSHGSVKLGQGSKTSGLNLFPGSESVAYISSDGNVTVGFLGLTSEAVRTYLATNSNVLDEFVHEMVSCDTIKSWLEKKKKQKPHKVNSTYAYVPETDEKYLNPNVSEITNDLLFSLGHIGDIAQILYELTNVVASGIHSDGFSLYVLANSANDLCLFKPNIPKDQRYKIVGSVSLGTTIAAHVAKTKQSLLIKDIIGDERFPKGTGIEGSNAQSVLCVPLVMPHDDIVGVMEFTRTWENKTFVSADIQLATAISVWTCTAIYQGQINRGLMKQSDLNGFLLEVFKIIFDDIISMEKLVTNIMTFTKDLVNADRAAMFLVDEEKQELYAEVFDKGEGENPYVKMDSIRFPLSKGIAGYVATTGEVVNIKDAYQDPRFNREIDKQTGYTTKNLLTMPIISKGKVIGVIQMVNKINNEEIGFSSADENNFETFAVYCAMALYLSKLYSNLQHQNTIHAVTLEQLTFHQTATEKEYNKLAARPYSKNISMDMLNTYDFYGKEHDKDLPQLFIMMTERLFGKGLFNISKLAQFVLTVRKNYRPVAYHNWHHGFNVAHCVYCILLRVEPEGIFNEHECMGLFIGAICHDLDHRGYNNVGMKNIDDPIAALYSTSIMEQHHYKQTITILQQEGHDIFDFLSEDLYKIMLDYIHKAILATDLALYFPNQKNLSKMLDEGTLDLNDPTIKTNTMALMMTAADLIAICKPWPTQQETAVLIYEEFWLQGDEEKRRGVKPIPMMDRDNKDNLPKEQVGFIRFVCGPCYHTLTRILPVTHELQDGCDTNLSQWQRVVAGQSTSLWHVEQSRVKEK